MHVAYIFNNKRHSTSMMWCVLTSYNIESCCKRHEYSTGSWSNSQYESHDQESCSGLEPTWSKEIIINEAYRGLPNTCRWTLTRRVQGRVGQKEGHASKLELKIVTFLVAKVDSGTFPTVSSSNTFLPQTPADTFSIVIQPVITGKCRQKQC